MVELHGRIERWCGERAGDGSSSAERRRNCRWPHELQHEAEGQKRWRERKRGRGEEREKKKEKGGEGDKEREDGERMKLLEDERRGKFATAALAAMFCLRDKTL